MRAIAREACWWWRSLVTRLKVSSKITHRNRYSTLRRLVPLSSPDDKQFFSFSMKFDVLQTRESRVEYLCDVVPWYDIYVYRMTKKISRKRVVLIETLDISDPCHIVWRSYFLRSFFSFFPFIKKKSWYCKCSSNLETNRVVVWPRGRKKRGGGGERERKRSLECIETRYNGSLKFQVALGRS